LSEKESQGPITPSGRLLDRRQLLIRGGGLAGAVGLMPLLAACGGSLGNDSTSSNGGKTIGFSYLYSEIPLAAPLKAFAKERGSQVGYQVLTDNIREGKIEEQIASLESFITRGVDALVVHIGDPSSYSGILKRSQEAEIPFFAYATALPGSDGAILFPFEEAAEELSADAAEWVNKNLGGEGEILVLGYEGDPLGTKASDTLGTGVSSKTKATVVAQQEALEQTTGLQITEDALKAHPDINVVMAWNDAGAVGASQALQRAGKDPAKCYVGSSEGSEEGAQAMLNGNEYIKTIELLSLKKLGYGVVELPSNYFKTGKKQNLIVHSPLLHYGETAKLDAVLKEYE
jgi:ABC-type sugar transport system substrate-binding protein